MKILSIALFLLAATTVHAQTNSMTVTLSWTDNSLNEEGFNIYRNNSLLSQVAAGVTTYSDITSGAIGYQYCYQISAFNHANVDGTGAVQESTRTNMVCATIPPLPIPTQPPPAPPSVLKIDTITTSSIGLRWQDNANNETSQEIQIAQATPPKNWTVPVSANITAYKVTGLKKNTLYNFKTRAVGDGGVSAYSNQVSATTEK